MELKNEMVNLDKMYRIPFFQLQSYLHILHLLIIMHYDTRVVQLPFCSPLFHCHILTRLIEKGHAVHRILHPFMRALCHHPTKI